MKAVSEILKEIRPEFDFGASADFLADGMLDSFDMVTLVAALDKEYGISIPGTDIIPENFKNISTIENLLRQSGRGVLMMQAFMDEFQICTRVPNGTEVKLVKYVAKSSSEGGF